MNNKILWIVTGLAALAFAAAGIGKLTGNAMMHESFANLGLPGWFGYFIGLCELAGAIGLLIRPLAALASAGLIIILCGAIYYHATYPPLSAGVPALVLLILCIYIYRARRGEMLKM